MPPLRGSSNQLRIAQIRTGTKLLYIIGLKTKHEWHSFPFIVSFFVELKCTYVMLGAKYRSPFRVSWRYVLSWFNCCFMCLWFLLLYLSVLFVSLTDILQTLKSLFLFRHFLVLVLPSDRMKSFNFWKKYIVIFSRVHLRQ